MTALLNGIGPLPAGMTAFLYNDECGAWEPDHILRQAQIPLLRRQDFRRILDFADLRFGGYKAGHVD